jgi:hypothetical protein
MIFSVLANAVLILHIAFVLFVVLAVPAIFLGALLGWGWVRLYWLRVSHLVGIGVVAAQSWFGLICPLTTLEMWLRRQGELTTYAGGFIEHWLQNLLYWEFPSWVFMAAYTVFALLVVATWYFVPPIRAKNTSAAST